MKREILFRGKRNDGMWVYGDLLHIERDFLKVLQIVDWSEKPYGHDVIPDTVGQFTGLKDKNGKEIYEGDLFKIGVEPNVFEVRFEAGCFVGYENGEQVGILGELLPEFCFVIGNIYDNPELIK